MGNIKSIYRFSYHIHNDTTILSVGQLIGTGILKHIIHSFDGTSGTTSKQAKAKHLLLVETSEKYTNTNGLLQELPAAIDLIYTIIIFQFGL